MPFLSLNRTNLGHTTFVAISYAWGNIASRTWFAIECDGRLLTITGNLHSALTRLRRDHGTVRLWVDAISINQSIHRPGCAGGASSSGANDASNLRCGDIFWWRWVEVVKDMPRLPETIEAVLSYLCGSAMLREWLVEMELEDMSEEQRNRTVVGIVAGGSSWEDVELQNPTLQYNVVS